MKQQNNSIDSSIKLVFLLKNLGFLLVIIFLFIICFKNVYNRVYGDNNYKNKLENLLKNGEKIIPELDQNYKINQIKNGSSYTNEYEFKYSFKVKNKNYYGAFTTEEFIPKEPTRLMKYMTVHYLPENPEINQIDTEVEYDYAKDKVEEHTIGMLLLNIFGLFITFILILYMLIIISDKVKNFGKPIENTYKNNQLQNDFNQKTDYKNLR
jgi:hypothetical protein